ncbi:MAG: hypothetical protein A2905_04245 [Candidatus Levybacteria bacterium RIFCSPLOWO2_01_FULL_36_10]|nr:MAG: hypothetical protein A2905_04245 [Candidatus Levybacteria bacterium RIFCSPLOWO2_01_FULL_36_10]
MINRILSIFQNYGFAIALVVAAVSSAGSLYFSEVAKFPPCDLCWYQRIFMFPQVIILLIATIKEDYSVKKYIIPLCVFGLFIAIYNAILQMYPGILPCSSAVSCGTKYVNFLGFITIPFMSVVAFLLILLSASLQKNEQPKTD